jgi:hypothetical protein
MQTATVPRCSRCPDGGKVTIVSLDASGVFRPLPVGWDALQFFRCQCGWVMPVPGPDAATFMPQRKKTRNQPSAMGAS